MKKILIIALLYVNVYSLSTEAMDGKNLYTENNCQKCHGVDSEFNPRSSKVQTLSNLDGWVSSCATHFNISWFPEEHDSVVKYLNETFYKLEK